MLSTSLFWVAREVENDIHMHVCKRFNQNKRHRSLKVNA